MMCASVAAQRGARVLLIDHAQTVGEKIRISGGGRCNFTNIFAQPEHYVSENPHFCRSALAQFSPQDFVALVKRYNIAFHEKHKGQLFCDGSAQGIIDLLRAECDKGHVRWAAPCGVHEVRQHGAGFELDTDIGAQRTARLVIATGGLSIPKMGATDFGFRLAKQFGLPVVPPRPGLVPLTFSADTWRPYVPLAGIAVQVGVRCGGATFDEDLLFTHRGLSGPAILQISTFWNKPEAIDIDLAPQWTDEDFFNALIEEKARSRQTLVNVLAAVLPRRLAEGWSKQVKPTSDQRIAEISDKALHALTQSIKHWRLTPSGTEGFRKAEVTRGGVATSALSQSSLEAKAVPGLHFIGEVVDVTGWLGGYNFQWAWASGVAAGKAVSDGIMRR